MRFLVDIDALTDGRPEGAVQDPVTGATHPFAGWVELLRVMEQRCGDVDEDRGDSDSKRGWS